MGPFAQQRRHDNFAISPTFPAKVKKKSSRTILHLPAKPQPSIMSSSLCLPIDLVARRSSERRIHFLIVPEGGRSPFVLDYHNAASCAALGGCVCFTILDGSSSNLAAFSFLFPFQLSLPLGPFLISHLCRF